MQLECIQCSLCIDACNEVMDKIGRPRGLIAYDSLANFEARAKGEKERFHIIRPRTIIYSTLIVVVGAFMLYHLLTRAELEVNVLRDRNPVFVQLSSGDIRNGYTVKILNKARTDRNFSINVTGLKEYEIRVEGVTDLTEDGLPVVHVEKDKTEVRQGLYLRPPQVS